MFGLLVLLLGLLGLADAKCPYKLKLETIAPVGNATEYCLGVSQWKGTWCPSSLTWDLAMKTKERCQKAIQAVSLDGQPIEDYDIRPASWGKYELFVPNIRTTTKICLTLKKPCGDLRDLCGGNKNCKYAIREASGLCAYEKCSL